jgi:hypothetical protein
VAELIQALSQELSEEDNILRHVILINALINLGRVERVPSENLVPKKSAQVTITSKSQKSSPDDLARSEQGLSPSPEPQDRLISLTNRHYLFCVFEPNYLILFHNNTESQRAFREAPPSLQERGVLSHALINFADLLFVDIEPSKAMQRRFTQYVTSPKRNVSRLAYRLL